MAYYRHNASRSRADYRLTSKDYLNELLDRAPRQLSSDSNSRFEYCWLRPTRLRPEEDDPTQQIKIARANLEYARLVYKEYVESAHSFSIKAFESAMKEANEAIGNLERVHQDAASALFWANNGFFGRLKAIVTNSYGIHASELSYAIERCRSTYDRLDEMADKWMKCYRQPCSS